jgi:hypothetical protein
MAPKRKSADTNASGKADLPQSAEFRRQSRLVDKLRISSSNWAQKRKRNADGDQPPNTTWKRQSWILPREEARAKAREFLLKYPSAAYWSEVESWRVLDDDRIEFTMRRLPSAD